MDDNRLQLEEEYEKQLLKDWNFAINTPMQVAIHDTHDCSRGGLRCVYGYWQKIT